jgi:hypothetical protein
MPTVVRGRFRFGIAAEEANEFNAIEVFLLLCPGCFGRPKSDGRHSQAEAMY